MPNLMKVKKKEVTESLVANIVGYLQGNFIKMRSVTHKYE